MPYACTYDKIGENLEENMAKRITYFDLAKGLGIILVVLGHISDISEELRGWISSFHMPLFFVIAGMLIYIKNEEKLSGKEIIAKKFKGIIVPYLWFSLIYVPIDIMNLFIHNVDNHTFVQNLLSSITFSGISVLWFLPALFLGEIFALAIIKAVSSKLPGKDNLLYVKVAVILALFISAASYLVWKPMGELYFANEASYVYATFLGFIRVFFRGLILSFFVVFGYGFQATLSWIDSKCQVKDGFSKARIITLIVGAFIFLVNVLLSLINGCVDTHFLILKNLPAFYLCACLGSVSLILICKGIGSIAYLEYFGRNSLIIMATHLQCYILYIGVLFGVRVNQYVTHAKSYIYAFNVVVVTMLIEIIVIEIINRFFPFVIGKKARKHQ